MLHSVAKIGDMHTLKILISTSFFSYESPSKALKLLYDLGFEYFELSHSYVDKISIDAIPSIYRETAIVAKSLGVKILAVHFPVPSKLVYVDLRNIDVHIEKLIEILKAIVYLEPKYIVFHTFIPRHSFIDIISRRKPDALSLNIKIFNKLLSFCSDHGIVASIENRVERNLFGSSIDDLRKLTRKLPELKLCIDIGHANVAKLDLEKAHKELGSCIVLYHVHDNNGLKDEHLPPFLGSIDWLKIRKFMLRAPMIPEVYCWDGYSHCRNLTIATHILLSQLLINESWMMKSWRCDR